MGVAVTQLAEWLPISSTFGRQAIDSPKILGTQVAEASALYRPVQGQMQNWGGSHQEEYLA